MRTSSVAFVDPASVAALYQVILQALQLGNAGLRKIDEKIAEAAELHGISKEDVRIAIRVEAKRRNDELMLRFLGAAERIFDPFGWRKAKRAFEQDARNS